VDGSKAAASMTKTATQPSDRNETFGRARRRSIFTPLCDPAST
jgi:hypothetical protein